MECDTCTRDRALLNIREAVSTGDYTFIYEEPDGPTVAEVEGIELDDRNAMLELLDDPGSLDFSQRDGDDFVSFICKDADGDIRYAVAFEYNLRSAKTRIRLSGRIPDPDRDKLTLDDFR